MGGVMFFFSLTLGTIFLARDNYIGYYLLLFALGFGLIGFLDDYIKNCQKAFTGIDCKTENCWTVGAVLFTGVFGCAFSENQYGGDDSAVWLDRRFGLALHSVFGFSDCRHHQCGQFNRWVGRLSFRCDHDCSVGVYAYWHSVPAVCGGDFGAALVGSCLGFLVFNHYPAKVFMGDTGSLALGGAVAALAIVTKTELLLPLIGIIYVAEAVSDIIQVSVYKRKKCVSLKWRRCTIILSCAAGANGKLFVCSGQ